MMLFTDRSISAMVHGLLLGGPALLALAASLFGLYLLARPVADPVSRDAASGPLTVVLGSAALATWLASIGGMYFVFPAYRAAPPEGATDLTAYPRSLLLSDPETAWLHSFGMETKEHLPWIAAFLATAVAYVAWQYRGKVFQDAGIRMMSATLLAAAFGIVSYVSLLGVFVNKVAPLE
jgi:hypothetical protein